METICIPYSIESVYREASKKRFTVVSLFAGGGGSSTGYKLAGGHVLAVNEFIDAARQTYSANYPDTPIIPDDIREITGNDVMRVAGVARGELDVLDGSPPCSSFSTCGKRERGWGQAKKYSDTVQRTDDLFYEYARMVEEVQPKVFIAENVKGLTTGVAKSLLGDARLSFGFKGAIHEDSFYRALQLAGYTVGYRVLNAVDFGVPQFRERLFIIGVRKDIGLTPTFPKKSRRVRLGESLVGVSNSETDLADADCSRYKVHQVLKKIPKSDAIVWANKLLGGGSYMNLCRASRVLPCPTVTQTNSTLGAAGVCHWDDRKFTIPELKRIQSFPDDYIVTGDYSARAERLARSVPPLLMRAIAKAILDNVLAI